MKPYFILFMAVFMLANNAVAGKILSKSDFTYLGAFRVPQGTLGGVANLSDDATSNTNFKPLAYNASRNSLYIGCNISSHQTNYSNPTYVVEISIPTIINNLSDVTALNTAAVLQNPADLFDGNINNLHTDGSSVMGGAGTGDVGEPWGLMVYNNKLIGTAWKYYDASGGEGSRSHFTASPNNWSSGVGFQGLYRVGQVPNTDGNATVNGGFVGGYMSSIPSAWQATLGKALTGRSGGPNVGRSSYGPCLWSFDPDALGSQDPTPATLLIGYPYPHRTLGDFSDAPNLLYNRSAGNNSVIFPVGSDSVLVFGNGALGIVLDGSGIPVAQSYSCTGAGTSNSAEAKSNAWLVANSPNGWTCGYTSLGASDIAGGASCCLDPSNTASSGAHTYTYTVGEGQTCYGLGTNSLDRARSNAWLKANSPTGWTCGALGQDAATTASAISAGDGCCYAGPGPYDKGTFGYPLNYQVWQYDANDLAAVKAGTKNYWEPIPTVWSFDLPFAPAKKTLDGVAYDPSTQRVYVSQAFGDGNYPLIHVFQLNLDPVVPAGPAEEGVIKLIGGKYSGTKL